MSLKKILLALFIPLLVYGCAAKPLPDLVWPQDPKEIPRIKYVKAYYGGNAFKEANLAAELILGGEGSFLMKKPMGAYVDHEGTLYVTDTAVQDVFVFNQSKKTTTSLRQMGVREINKPIAIASDEKTGRIFFTDSFANWVTVLNKDGSVVTIDAADAPEKFKQPTGVAVDPVKRRLYVTDTQHHNIKVFDADTLKYVSTIGTRGKEGGQFNFPSHITTDKNGRLYVTDTQNGRVEVFNNEGKFIMAFGQLGDLPGMFGRPKGIGVDSEGHIYIADAAFNNIQIFDEEGRILLSFGGFGEGRGEMILPAGLAVDRDDYIYVVDSWGRRVNIYEYLGEKHKEREARAASQPPVPKKP
ncbi:MAG: 6-bladed beta-propeller [Deltaproteobacteria bacterium]|nr:6-bladed beta-propeller [Deltaproteobacteria bacterium]